MVALKEADATNTVLDADTLSTLSDVRAIRTAKIYLPLTIQFATFQPHILPSLLMEAVSSSNHPPELYEVLAKQCSAPAHPDQLIFVVCEMLERNLQPSSSLIHSTIRACCEWAAPRLALELAEKIESDSRDGRRVDTSCWVDILISSAENQFVS